MVGSEHQLDWEAHCGGVADEYDDVRNLRESWHVKRVDWLLMSILLEVLGY